MLFRQRKQPFQKHTSKKEDNILGEPGSAGCGLSIEFVGRGRVKCSERSGFQAGRIEEVQEIMQTCTVK